MPPPPPPPLLLLLLPPPPGDVPQQPAALNNLTKAHAVICSIFMSSNPSSEDECIQQLLEKLQVAACSSLHVSRALAYSLISLPHPFLSGFFRQQAPSPPGSTKPASGDAPSCLLAQLYCNPV
jgi:hypothetical protein